MVLESPANAIKAAEKIVMEDSKTPDEQIQQCRKWTCDFLQTRSGVETQDYFQHCFVDRDITIKEFFSRNEIMAYGIDRSIRKGHFSFVAIGFGHCLGKKGAPQLLRDEYGLDVKEIKPEPPSLLHLNQSP